MTAPARLVYPGALLAGLFYAVWLLSWHAIFPADPLHTAFLGDEAVSVIGQRYLLSGPWLWPPTLAPGLGANGTNVALTDSIPLITLLVKPFRAWLLPGASVSTAWAALAFALQPAAAVFALRGAGERRPVPALAVAVLACSMPTLFNRFGHQALCTHAAILAALGLYLRLAAGRRLWPAAVALMLCCVLIHPYIFAMVAAVLTAVPLTLLLRGDRRWRRGLAGILFGCAASGGLAWSFGFGGSRPSFGFGYYSMNLLAPVLPGKHSMFPDLSADATGGQLFEGCQYLGFGVLLLLATGLVQAVRGRAGAWRRHWGLLLVLAALSVFALSNRGYAGTVPLFYWNPVPPLLEQFRATSRFFWPVAYTVVVAGVAVAARSLPPGASMAVLAAALILQLADTQAWRTWLRQGAAGGTAWMVDHAKLEPIFAAHRKLTMWPTFGCGSGADQPVDMQTLLIASETLMRTNTMATARDRGELDCDRTHTMGAPTEPGELRVVTHAGNVWWMPGSERACRRLNGLVLCSVNAEALAQLDPLDAAPLPSGPVQPADPAFSRLLGAGWSVPEPGGVWSEGPVASLVFRQPGGDAPVLQLTLTAFAPVPGGAQTVEAWVDGKAVAAWRLAEFQPTTVLLPLPAGEPGIMRVELRIAHPTRPTGRGIPGDARSLGVMLQGVQRAGGS